VENDIKAFLRLIRRARDVNRVLFVMGTPVLAEFFDDLIRCETRPYNALNTHLRQRQGIVTSQFEFLHHIRDHSGCRVADLSVEYAVGVGATSKGVDRLERNGWVARRPNPSDRRSSLLVLTESAVELVDASERTFTAHLAEMIAGTFTAALLATAAHALSALRVTLERDGSGCPPAEPWVM
jgi:DNA-binding MarR family transcriptional regulator